MPTRICEWVERCDLPSVGMAGHPIDGVINICQTHHELFEIPLIKVHTTEVPA